METFTGPLGMEPDPDPPFLNFAPKKADHGRKLGMLAGIAMLVGVLFPFMVSVFGQLQILWIWDILEGAPGSVTAYFLLTLVAGIAACLVSRKLSGARRTWAWLAIAGALLVFQALALAADPQALWNLPGLGAGVWMLGFILAITGTFVGHGVARELPEWRGGYLIAAACGTVTMVLMLLPILPDGSALAEALFDKLAWRVLWGLNFFLLFTLGHAVYCQLGYLPAWNHPGHQKTMLRLGKYVIYALPAYIVVMSTTEGVFLAGFSMMVKFTGTNYGFLLLLSVGLTALVVDLRSRRQEAAAQPAYPPLEGGGTILRAAAGPEGQAG